MKGLPFGKREAKLAPASFDQVIQQLSLHDGQHVLEILHDYYTDVTCWSEVTDVERTVRCRWCNAEGESAYRIRHAMNCPIEWLQQQSHRIDDHLFKLPRLRIGRPRRNTEVIPTEKLLPGEVEDYVDVRRRDAGTR